MTWRVLACLVACFTFAACKTSNEGSGLASEEGNEAVPTASAGGVSAKPVAVLEDLKSKTADELYVMFRDAKGDGAIPLGHGTGYPILMADAPTLNALANKI